MRLFLLFLLSGIACTAYAQIPAPDFLCTRSEAGQEILTWSNVEVTDCGNYVSTDIYRSSEANGPYSLLTSLTDPNLTEYSDSNPGGGQLFYYFQYTYDCGSSTQPSDTLDNFIPATPDIKFISAEEDEVTLYWERSVSPEVNRYVIVDVSSGTSVPLDTVGDVTSYRFPLADSLRNSAAYRVVALDACGNDSPLSDTRSIFRLRAEGGEGCVQDVQLFPAGNSSGFPFDAGPDSVFLSNDDTVRLYTGSPGEPLTLYSTTPAAVFPLATYPEANDGEEICFAVELSFAGDSIRQRSDTACYQFFLEQAVRDFDLYGVEIQDNGELRFGYQDDVVQADEYTVVLEVAAPADTIFYSPGAPLFPGGELTTNGGVPLNRGDSLRFVLTDSCGRAATSNYVSPVWLDVRNGADGAAILDWTAPHDLPGMLLYTVVRIIDDSTVTNVATGLPGLSYTDTEPGPGQLCYRIEANYTPPGADTSYTFLSGIQCIVEPVDIYFPNVFSPNAVQDVNREFRPFFNSVSGLEAYYLRVFDRWVAIVFESEDPNVAWDGTIGGRNVPTGTYVYDLQYTPLGKYAQQLTGTVHLIR
ncbi:MAG: gliding motility-associated C-terminal domain-containing protein [Lewinella sp.]